jgi:hypothetical protein
MASKSKEPFWANFFEYWFGHWPASETAIPEQSANGQVSGKVVSEKDKVKKV